MGNLMQKSERKAFKALTKKNTFINRNILVFDDPPLPNESRSHGRGVEFDKEVLLVRYDERGGEVDKSMQALNLTELGADTLWDGMEDEGWEIEEGMLEGQEHMLPPMDSAGHNYLPHPKVAQMMGRIGVHQELYIAAGNSVRVGQGGVYQGKLGSPGGRRSHEPPHGAGDGQNHGVFANQDWGASAHQRGRPDGGGGRARDRSPQSLEHSPGNDLHFGATSSSGSMGGRRSRPRSPPPPARTDDDGGDSDDDYPDLPRRAAGR